MQDMARMTKQKNLLHTEVKASRSFFDAYKLHSNVQRKDKKIGIATVYRFLNNLEAKGEVHSFICDNKKVYSNNKTSHAEFKCEECGKLKHVKIDNVDFLNKLTDDYVCHFQIELTGLCSSCKGRERR